MCREFDWMTEILKIHAAAARNLGRSLKDCSDLINKKCIWTNVLLINIVQDYILIK